MADSVHVDLIAAGPGFLRWSPHLKSLLEAGWLRLREMLDQRPTDGVGVIAEDAGGLRAGWMERRQVIAQARRNGRPLHSIERDDVPPDHVRVVVSARDGEVAACRIPLSSVTFEPVRGIG